MRLFHLTVVPATLIAILLAASASAADSAAAKAAAKVLLEKCWDKTATARSAVDAVNIDSPALAGSALVLNAHWLVLMHQGRYDEALASVQATLKGKAANDGVLSAGRAEVWIYTVKKDYRQAIISADRLGQALAATQPANDKAVAALSQQDGTETLAFLGRVAGFVEGPAGKAADQELRKKFEARLIARLTEAQKKEFDEAKAEVLGHFGRLTGAAAEATQEEKQSAEEEKEKKVTDLSKEKEELAKEKAKIDEKAQQVAADIQRKLADLDRQDAPLQQRLTVLQNQVTALTPQFNQQDANAQRLQQTAAREQNPQLRPTLQRDADRAQDTANNTKFQINTMNTQIATTVAQRNVIQQQRIAVQGGAAVQGQQLENMRRGVDHDKLKTENKLKRAANAKPTAGGKTLTLEIQAHAFSTYDTFPFEEIRNHLLAKLQ